MSKTDKELTAEIVIAYINANQTQPSLGTYNGASKVEKYVTVEGICKCIKAVHTTLQMLESPRMEQPE